MASFNMQNGLVSVDIDEHASEIHSFRDLDSGREYMWQGDPKYWSGRNPTLFPMVGSTWDKILHINGREYHTGNHGFTRHSDFTCIEHANDKIVMRLADSAETREQYPFAFTLLITYELRGKTLTVSYEIVNDNETVMPFNFGLHPAFNCPDTKTYHIAFNAPETIDWNGVKLDHGTELALDPDKLAETIVIHNPVSTEVSLTDGTHGVRLGFRGYEWLAFWSPHAPFVCLEPWYSHADFAKVEVPFEKREGTRFLNPHDIFRAGYTITVF